jgi:hypothetical protein
MEYTGMSVDFTEPQLINNPKPDTFPVRLLQGVLFQAVHDVLSNTTNHQTKGEALEWLTDEDNEVLQLCLSVCNINLEHLLIRVVNKQWNLNL